VSSVPASEAHRPNSARGSGPAAGTPGASAAAPAAPARAAHRTAAAQRGPPLTPGTQIRSLMVVRLAREGDFRVTGDIVTGAAAMPTGRAGGRQPPDVRCGR